MKILLAEKRNELGMTIRKLEAISGVSRATISRIENGTANPTIDVLCKLAAALGVTLDALVQCDNRRE